MATKMSCPECNADVPQNAKVCPACKFVLDVDDGGGGRHSLAIAQNRTEAFGSTRIQETSTAALEAQERAEVEARCILALRRPRDMDQVLSRILTQCRRPSFAEESIYERQLGGDTISGFSVRFAEAMALAMGNIFIKPKIVSETAEQYIVNVTVMDLESNVTYSNDAVVPKTVERSKGRGPGATFGQRQNSKGQITYTVRATSDEMLAQNAAIQSKLLRNGILRLVPGDILESAWDLLIRTQNDEAAKDPNAARKQLLTSFTQFGLTAADLAVYLGHPFAEITPPEIVELNRVGRGMKEEGSSWAEVIAARKEARGEVSATEAEQAPKANSLQEKIRAARGGTAGNATPAAVTSTEQPSATIESQPAKPPPAPEPPALDPEDVETIARVTSAETKEALHAIGTAIAGSKKRIGNDRYKVLFEAYQTAKSKLEGAKS